MDLARPSKMTRTTLFGRFILAMVLAASDPRLAAGEPPTEITVLHDIRYREGASRQWKLDLAMVQDKAGPAKPGIVVIHGGGWLEGDKSSFASREHGVPGNIVELRRARVCGRVDQLPALGRGAFPRRAGGLQRPPYGGCVPTRRSTILTRPISVCTAIRQADTLRYSWAWPRTA